MSALMAWGKSPMRTELNKLPDQMAKVECQAETGRWASAKVWALVRRNLVTAGILSIRVCPQPGGVISVCLGQAHILARTAGQSGGDPRLRPSGYGHMTPES